MTQFLLRRTNCGRISDVCRLSHFEVPGDKEDPAWGALLDYPTFHPSRATAFGPYQLDVSVDAPLAAGRLPLLVLSHGSGGSPLLYRSVRLLLARNGSRVALPKHPGNSLGDDALAGTVSALRDRPRQLVRLLDALCADTTLRDSIVPGAGHRDRTLNGGLYHPQ